MSVIIIKELPKNVAVVDYVDGKHYITAGSKWIADYDVILFLENGELKGIKAGESPIIPLTECDLEKLNDDWTFRNIV